VERRRSDRSNINATVFGRVPATPVAVTICDISIAGCRVQSDGSMSPGSTVLLGLLNELEVAGQVVWRKNGWLGIKFHEPIPAADLKRFINPADDQFHGGAGLTDNFGRQLPGLSARIWTLSSDH
jgi:hypothetical protein